MIEAEIEDEAWRASLPDAVAVAERAARAALVAASGPGATSDRRDAGKGRPAMGGFRVAVLLTGDAEVAELNARFRGRSGPTNVLSFPAPATAAPQLGDLALAHGVCAREAQAQAKPLAHHLAHLVVHGALHLVGYDHETDAEAEVMEAMERTILRGLDIPDPYAGEPDRACHGGPALMDGLVND